MQITSPVANSLEIPLVNGEDGCLNSSSQKMEMITFACHLKEALLDQVGGSSCSAHGNAAVLRSREQYEILKVNQEVVIN